MVRDWFVQSAGSGSLLLAVPVAIVAGLASFLSPCVIPLVPGYLSYATGISGAALADGVTAGQRRARMLGGSALFVAGFSLVFVLLGTASGAVGSTLVSHRRELAIGLGLLNVALGLVFLGFVPGVRAWAPRVSRVGLGAAPVLGFLFGLGWTPCVGPTLAVILNLALWDGAAARGALLSACYAMGRGVPFLVVGLAYERSITTIRVLRRHLSWVSRAGGLMMICVGLLLVTGWWDQLVQWLQIAVIDGSTVPL